MASPSVTTTAGREHCWTARDAYYACYGEREEGRVGEERKERRGREGDWSTGKRALGQGLPPAPLLCQHYLSSPSLHRPFYPPYRPAEKKAAEAGAGASSHSSTSASAGPASAPAGCEAERAAYEGQCLKSWVKYWDDRVKRGIPLRGGPGS